MNLRQRLRKKTQGKSQNIDPDEQLYRKFGVIENPFPASNQNLDNRHFRLDADEIVEDQIEAFVSNLKSRTLVVEGTQGVGKTNFLKHFEAEIQDAVQEIPGYYHVRYTADPEASFTGTIRLLFEDFGIEYLRTLSKALSENSILIKEARSHDMQNALENLAKRTDDDELLSLFLQWIRGSRVLRLHRTALGVQFRLDTVESMIGALKDFVRVSSKAQCLRGIFLLLDELEKQDGVLAPVAVVRYLSSLRAIIDALSDGLFLMLAITPDASERYAAALPALRSRLQNTVELHPLMSLNAAQELARFYLDAAKTKGRSRFSGLEGGTNEVLSDEDAATCFAELESKLERRAEKGVRQREYLHKLSLRADENIRRARDLL